MESVTYFSTLNNTTKYTVRNVIWVVSQWFSCHGWQFGLKSGRLTMVYKWNY